ncbi:TIGR02302 family protein [Aureimonas populi]|uniref:TIGR02302 family protein n=1 Tax=Aureimonas populi TaxID=1701758 RepID=A0ABW5CJA4_9HYPH|nr:TIGR02302 family protein [Aureimonas populi]
MADRTEPEARTSSLGLVSARAGAFAALLAERLWPTLFWLAGLVALFATLAWFGVFAALPSYARLGLLGLFAFGALFVLWRARGIRVPAPHEVVARIEAASGLQHQPLAVQSDRPVSSDDPFAGALWREHQRRMAARLKTLRAGGLRARTERLDPLGLRALLALSLVTAFAFSFGPNGGRLADALAPVDGALAPGVRVDAWVTPPAYTGVPPIFLAAGDEGEREVPAGSVLSVRVSDSEGLRLGFGPRTGEPAVEIAPNAAEGGAAVPAGQYEFALEESGAAVLETRLRTLSRWSFSVLPDLPPLIEFDGEPRQARNGALEMNYRLRDDYGVARGEVEVEVLETLSTDARPLIAPPQINLSLPRRTRGEARGRTSVNLAESPYAGARVSLTLAARDDAGQTGRSEPMEMTLPARAFANPLARAVVEQRRLLALDANLAPRVVEMLDAVTLHGDSFIEKPGDYIALRAARSRIAGAASDEHLVSAVDFLWQIALGIEDGNLSTAEQRLRDAQEALAQALEEGASEEEIAALMDELRAAMDEFMAAMAEAMRNQPPRGPMDMGNVQELRPQDLQRMLDRIEDLARSGSPDAARELLAELQAMMNNLQAMQGQPQPSQQQSEAQQRMNEAGELLQRQQELMNRTFELGREQARQRMGQDGMPGDPGEGEPMSAEELQQRMQELQGEQEALREQLEGLQQSMEEMGMEPAEGFGEAQEAMRGAEGALGEGDDGRAVGRQGEAMEALRRGAADMMSQMQAMAEGGQPQPGQGQGGPGGGQAQQREGRDPLGRERPDGGTELGQNGEVPDEIDVQRARRILEQIRERLGDRLSPQMERDYLERLLRTP